MMIFTLQMHLLRAEEDPYPPCEGVEASLETFVHTDGQSLTKFMYDNARCSRFFNRRADCAKDKAAAQKSLTRIEAIPGRKDTYDHLVRNCEAYFRARQGAGH